MRQYLSIALVLASLAAPAAAQTGRVGGTVKDDTGQPIKGAMVMAENPTASPTSFTATTDDKGRFSIIGLRKGDWTFTAQAPGFSPESAKMPVQTIGQPNPPMAITLKKGGTPAPVSALGSVAAKDLQSDLNSAAQLYNAQKWDDAIAAYRAILTKAPALSDINLQIAAASRNKKDFDGAIAAYSEILKTDPNNDRAKVGIGMTNLEKGDLDAAEKTLQTAGQTPTATREVYYGLGEVEFAKGKTDEAVTAYSRAAQIDPRWGKPVFALGKVALNKGDTKGAIEYFSKVIDVDPTSPEAAQAKTVIEQLKK
jgi:Flp pilus assembly protein TadD